jgi:hypothetical protein
VVTAALPPLQGGDGFLQRTHGPLLRGLPQEPAAVRTAGHKPGVPGGAEQGEWVSFDWRQVQLRQEEGVWKLAAGAYVLATFGADEQAGRQALAAVNHYHFTEHCRIGAPEPLFSYFLVHGQAPRGLMFGLRSQAFGPDKVSVQPLGRQWALCSGDQVLLILGEQPDEARQLLEVIRRNQFDRLCRIGPPDGPGMTFLVRVH